MFISYETSGLSSRYWCTEHKSTGDVYGFNSIRSDLWVKSYTHGKQVFPREAEPDSPAELEKDLLKDQDWTRAAQDGERLTSKQRVGHARQRRPEQRLYGTLERGRQGGVNTEEERILMLGFIIPSVGFLRCFLWWLLPADLRTWWQATCRRSTGRGRTPNTAGWRHRGRHSTGRALSSGCRSPNHRRSWQTEDGFTHSVIIQKPSPVAKKKNRLSKNRH